METWHRLVRSAPLWTNQQLSNPTKFHDSSCHIETGDCSCRTPLDQLSSGMLVVLLEEKGDASLVSIAGHLPVWIESAALEKTRLKISESPVGGSTPSDYLDWIGNGSPVPAGRVRSAPRGGHLVLIRAEKELREAWRWIGHVHQNGKLAVLLVDPTVPLDQLLDASTNQVRVVPLEGREARNVLLPISSG